MVAIFVGAVTVGLVFATCLERADSIREPRRASVAGSEVRVVSAPDGGPASDVGVSGL